MTNPHQPTEAAIRAAQRIIPEQNELSPDQLEDEILVVARIIDREMVPRDDPNVETTEDKIRMDIMKEPQGGPMSNLIQFTPRRRIKVFIESVRYWLKEGNPKTALQCLAALEYELARYPQLDSVHFEELDPNVETTEDKIRMDIANEQQEAQ